MPISKQKLNLVIKDKNVAIFGELLELNEKADSLLKIISDEKFGNIQNLLKELKPFSEEETKILPALLKEIKSSIDNREIKVESPDLSKLEKIMINFQKSFDNQTNNIKSIKIQQNPKVFDVILSKIELIAEKVKKEPKIDLSGIKSVIDDFRAALDKIPNVSKIDDESLEKLEKVLNKRPIIFSGGGVSRFIGITDTYGDKISPLKRATDLEGKGKVAVGTTAIEITFTGIPESIIISADTGNTGTLYVGKSDVASDGSNAIVFLEAGESIEIDYDDTSNALYIVASVAGQNYWSGALI